MQCDPSRLRFDDGFDWWEYNTVDDSEDIYVPGFFDPANSLFQVGDLIRIDGDNINMLQVISIEDGVVEVSEEVEEDDDDVLAQDEIEEY